MKKKTRVSINLSFFIIFSLTAAISCKKEIVEVRKMLPVLTTSTATGITQTTVFLGGTVTSDGGISIPNVSGKFGGTPITARGTCWNTTPEPTTANNKTTDGTGTGIFSSSISGLKAGTAYYARAYATNSAGTAYGNQINFSSLPVALSGITTSPISGITSTTASGGGVISSDGGGSITARGICWNTSPIPTVANSKSSDGNGIGTFTSSLTGLSAGTTYYVRAYAINSAGTSYGTDIQFTTATVPTLTTTVAGTITQISAISGGNISTDGRAAVTARGVCWSTTPTPTITNSKTTDGTGTGSFSSSLTGLTISTTYYIRAYATNIVGTAYGNQLSFTTSPAALPTLTTTAVTLSSLTTASGGGNITNDGGASVSVRGVCWSTSQNPTVALTTKTTDGIGSGVFISSMTGLIINSTYYVRAYATNTTGTAYGNQVSFKVGIGAVYQGGIIAYVLQSGDPGYNASVIHGLIAAPGDQSTGIRWYNGSSVTTNATATLLGTGNANTNTIVTKQGTGSYAARLCYDLVLGGYSDWYLPSKDELNKLYINRVAIGGFVSNYYWTSSESSITNAWVQYFNATGAQAVTTKSTTFYVRAVRAF